MPFGTLWLPVLLSGAAMHFLGFIAWMVLRYHEREWKGLPDEEAGRKLLGSLPAGQYRIPMSHDPKAMKDPEFLKRYETGPVGTIQLEKPGPMGFGRRIAMILAWNLAVAFLTGYILRHSIPRGAPFMQVFQVAGATCFGFCAMAHVPDAIWFAKSWSRVRNEVIDALAYGLVTGAIFAALWPGVV
jgi:hypothetical protein